MLHVGHYLNQFFAGVGGEERANHPAEPREGPVGPGHVLQAALGDTGRVVSTATGYRLLQSLAIAFKGFTASASRMVLPV